jgi:O-antigen/teichoic acid export membrane protein
MNREFLLNAIFLVGINLLIKPFYVFGIERTIQDTVGAEVYGLYATLFSFSYLFFIVNDFGIHYFNNRTIAQHPTLFSGYLEKILLPKAILAVLFLVLVFLFAILRSFDKEVFHLLFFVSLNHILISLVAYLRSNISGLGLYRTDSLISSLDKLFLIAFCGILLWGNLSAQSFRLEWFVYAQNISWSLTAIIAFIVIRNRISKPIRLKIRFGFLLVVLKKSAPYALAVFLMTAYTRLDIVILEWLLPDGRYEAGVYAASYRLLDAFNVIGLLFAGLLLPMFSNLLKRERRPFRETSSLLNLSLQLIWASTISLAISCYFFKEEIMFWLYPNTADKYYGDVLGYIILTLIPFSGIYIFSTLLTANGNLKQMNLLFVTGITMNLILNILLIPSYKALGAGLAALITQTFILVGQMMLVHGYMKVPVNWKQYLKTLIFVGLVVLLCKLLLTLTETGWVLNFALSICAGLFLALLLKLINLRSLLQLIKT